MNEIIMDGRPLPFVDGQTVAAALVAAGRVAWRTTRVRQRPRGVFCGIGVCFDCLVTIDGAGGQRACLVLARAGMTVTTGEGDDE
ncbi:(2Fe-2S)-binding protein [Streptomyces sp. NPDC000987]|uniref:(2Fe-2S)-binding protein n=1 Tax=Streptomyces sp. NPDC000987 TaxID=3154374 RepID=UPI00331E0AFD